MKLPPTPSSRIMKYRVQAPVLALLLVVSLLPVGASCSSDSQVPVEPIQGIREANFAPSETWEGIREYLPHDYELTRLAAKEIDRLAKNVAEASIAANPIAAGGGGSEDVRYYLSSPIPVYRISESGTEPVVGAVYAVQSDGEIVQMISLLETDALAAGSGSFVDCSPRMDAWVAETILAMPCAILIDGGKQYLLSSETASRVSAELFPDDAELAEKIPSDLIFSDPNIHIELKPDMTRYFSQRLGVR